MLKENKEREYASTFLQLQTLYKNILENMTSDACKYIELDIKFFMITSEQHKKVKDSSMQM